MQVRSNLTPGPGGLRLASQALGRAGGRHGVRRQVVLPDSGFRTWHAERPTGKRHERDEDKQGRRPATQHLRRLEGEGRGARSGSQDAGCPPRSVHPPCWSRFCAMTWSYRAFPGTWWICKERERKKAEWTSSRGLQRRITLHGAVTGVETRGKRARLLPPYGEVPRKKQARQGNAL